LSGSDVIVGRRPRIGGGSAPLNSRWRSWLLIAGAAMSIARPVAASNPLVEGESPPRFQEADMAFEDRADPARALFALERYRSLLESDPTDWEAGWRVAMAAYHAGTRVAKDSESSERFWVEGRDAGRRAAKLQPDCVPCNFWTAIDMAAYGHSVGVVRMLFTLSEIRKRLERVVDIDPAYAFAGAPRLLAMIDDGLPRFMGGSDKRSERYYRQAISLVPEEPLNFEYFGEFLEKKGRLEEALEMVELGLATPPPTPERVESISSMNTLRRMKPRIEAKLAERAEKAAKRKESRMPWPFRR
jgi:tetratricopeptide (TPR) repeat protein